MVLWKPGSHDGTEAAHGGAYWLKSLDLLGKAVQPDYVHTQFEPTSFLYMYPVLSLKYSALSAIKPQCYSSTWWLGGEPGEGHLGMRSALYEPKG